MSKIKNLKRSNFGQSVFFRAKNALCCKTGGAIIGLQVSKQVGMVFSSSPTCLSLERVNPPIPTQFWCRNQKIWGKRISSLKSTGRWRSQIMDGVCWIMISNQLTDVMWQNRHISPQQNYALMKICRKNVARWACTRSKASINDCMGGTDIVCRLHHLVNENYQQELGCHSSGWWRNRWWKHCLSWCTFLDLS